MQIWLNKWGKKVAIWTRKLNSTMKQLVKRKLNFSTLVVIESIIYLLGFLIWPEICNHEYILSTIHSSNMQYSVVRLINNYMLVHCKKHQRGVQKVEKGAFSKQVTHPYSGSKNRLLLKQFYSPRIGWIGRDKSTIYIQWKLQQPSLLTRRVWELIDRPPGQIPVTSVLCNMFRPSRFSTINLCCSTGLDAIILSSSSFMLIPTPIIYCQMLQRMIFILTDIMNDSLSTFYDSHCVNKL